MKLLDLIPDHPAHPDHVLVKITTTDEFKCHSCEQKGDSGRIGYGCSFKGCNKIKLHACCANAPAKLKHDQFNNDVFLFNKPVHPAGSSSNGKSCALCKNPAPGFIYLRPAEGNTMKDAYLHPCCALRQWCVCKNPNADMISRDSAFSRSSDPFAADGTVAPA